jgi:hypothetical protein
MAFWSARRLASILWAVALTGGAPGPARALEVGPKVLPLTVAGVLVEIPVAGSLDVHTDATAVAVAASATGDLRAIQDHALAIAREIKLPREPCAHKNLNLVVDRIDGATIAPVADTAVVALSGHVTLWLCKKILGETIKAQIASDSVRIAAPVALFTPSPQTIALRLAGPATIETGDALTREAARAVIGDLDAALTLQLGKMLDAARARAVLPPLPGLEATIESAAFAQDGATLTIRASGHARMSAAALASLLGFLGR